MLIIISLLIFHFLQQLAQDPFPIQFSIPECKIIKEIAPKNRDFAFIIPGVAKTYIYKDEQDYYKDYQNSYFAITRRKGGWDCMRHYEILANGCIPYFIDLEQCDNRTMFFLPKKLILEAMHLRGVPRLSRAQSENHINLRLNRKTFNKARYYQILNELVEYTRKHLTTAAMASYILKTINYDGNGTILFLSNDLRVDYLRCLTLIGLREILGSRLIDYYKVPHVYNNYSGDISKLYGKGFSCTKIIDDIFVNRENIEQRIKEKEFDIIIYGSIHRGLLFHDTALKHYDKDKIFYLDGEDFHDNCPYARKIDNLFLREFYF